MQKNTRAITVLCIIIFLALCGHLSPPDAMSGERELWRKDKPCGRRLPDLKPVTMQSCLDACCLEIPGTVRFCACQKSKDTGETQMLLERTGLPPQEWISNVFPLSFGPESFRLDAVDLDGDKKEELLIGAMTLQSMGMGVQYWTVWAANETSISEPIEIEDYGVMGFPTRAQEENRCYMLATRWIEGWEPGRGAGLYLAGRWYKYVHGEFSAVYDRPAVYHRYLYSLQDARGESFSKDHPEPLIWYASKKAHALVGPYPFE
jgi:hypothetical protein